MECYNSVRIATLLETMETHGARQLPRITQRAATSWGLLQRPKGKMQLTFFYVVGT